MLFHRLPALKITTNEKRVASRKVLNILNHLSEIAWVLATLPLHHIDYSLRLEYTSSRKFLSRLELEDEKWGEAEEANNLELKVHVHCWAQLKNEQILGKKLPGRLWCPMIHPLFSVLITNIEPQASTCFERKSAKLSEKLWSSFCPSDWTFGINLLDFIENHFASLLLRTWNAGLTCVATLELESTRSSQFLRIIVEIQKVKVRCSMLMFKFPSPFNISCQCRQND